MINEIIDRIQRNPQEPASVALTAIYEIGLEVIGRDEDTEEAFAAELRLTGRISKTMEKAIENQVVRNDLRASQRKAWAKACGVKL